MTTALTSPRNAGLATVWLSAALALAVFVPGVAHADVVLENTRMRAVLGDDGCWRSLVEKTSGKELAPDGKRLPCASITVGNRTLAARSAARDGDRLRITFDGQTELIYQVRTAEDWIAFGLKSLSGPRPDRVTLLRLAVRPTAHFGPRINGVWDDKTSVCLSAINLQTQAASTRRGDHVELAVVTQDTPGPKLEGAGAALIAAPTTELRGILRALAASCGLPRNEGPAGPSKELPLARDSYWFLSFGEKDVDKVIDYCRRSRIRQVMLMCGSWCRQVGHYTFRMDQYPNGIESLRRTVARLHENGILVGMHCFASKISKTDAYVTPKPDRGFWVDMSAELAADISADEKSIRVAGDLGQWPGSPVGRQKMWEGGVEKHREAVIDDEIIRYASIGPEGRWDTFLGCERGAWRTAKASHAKGSACRHYGVDGCINGYIVDQETSLLDETTTRLAEVFNACDFDMVYFDGGEDVPRSRFEHYVSKFQATAMGKFRKRPLVHMGTIMTHNLWHSYTRTATVDTYLNTLHGHVIAGGKADPWPTVRQHIDRSVHHLLTAEDDMLPGELGWFGIWPKGRGTEGLQLDEIEYLMAKSLAHNAPISLETSFSQMESHPLTPGILEIVGAYEELRRNSAVPPPTRKMLAELGKDFLLVRLRGEQGPVEFVPVQACRVEGKPDLRAMIGRHGDF